jgi:long-chain acyl-CoA synthetase
MSIARVSHGLRRAQCLRDVLIGGEPLGLALSARIRRLIAPARLFDIYGLTETSTCDFFLLPEDYPAHPDSIGRPSPGVQSRIVDEAGVDLASGETGELMIRSDFMMAGYLDDPGLTAASLRGGWLATGDLARATDDGFVSIVGRSKELIVRGGNKVTPQEIERAACECPGVAAAMATGLPDRVLGERIHLMVVAAPGVRLDAGGLAAFLRGRLERFKQPDFVYLGDTLPTGRTGKLDRRRLREMIEDGMIAALAAS